MCYWKVELTTIGTLMVTRRCRIRGGVLTIHVAEREATRRVQLVWRGASPKSRLRLDLIICGLWCGQVGERALNKKKGGIELLECRSSTISEEERNFFHRSGGHGVQGHHEERAPKVGIADGICHALQGSKLWAWRAPLRK